MSRKVRGRGLIDLPKGIHRVTSRGRQYFYYQAGRGTKMPGTRTRLPDDPHSPEFWQALRQAQGLVGPIAADTVNALIDAYLCSPDFRSLAPATRAQYPRILKIAREAWGDLPVAGLRPVHVRTLMDAMGDKPAMANLFLSVLKTVSSWGRSRDLIENPLADGVKRYKLTGGHRPWTPEQIQAAHDKLTGPIRRGVMLALYTGQRGSDVVRLGPTDIDDGGFLLRQQKTGLEVWCPVVSELAAEMATWERRPGPFMRKASGKPYSRADFTDEFAAVRKDVPELAGASLHGLRSTAVIRLRRFGLTPLQIEDIVGMSPQMIRRYCRFADRKASGQAALISLTERAQNANCKTSGKWKTKG